MIIFLMFACALFLSGAAAFYSVIGLMAIFAAAPIPIAIMGSALEVSKLVVASWMYRNWPAVPKLLKGYFIIALLILMLLTSMGIFGYLSKAHLDQGIPTGDVVAKVALIDEKIKTEETTIESARKALAQLDSQVDQLMSRTTSEKGIMSSVSVRARQKKERAALVAEIQQSQQVLKQLREERAPAATELRKVEAEVGPIKYIAALIYGEDVAGDQTTLEKAVKWVTIMIVAVFDPLAVLMLIAANWSLYNPEPRRRSLYNEKETVAQSTKADIDDVPTIDVVQEQEIKPQREPETIQPSQVEISVETPPQQEIPSPDWKSRPVRQPRVDIK